MSSTTTRRCRFYWLIRSPPLWAAVVRTPGRAAGERGSLRQRSDGGGQFQDAGQSLQSMFADQARNPMSLCRNRIAHVLGGFISRPLSGGINRSEATSTRSVVGGGFITDFQRRPDDGRTAVASRDLMKIERMTRLTRSGILALECKSGDGAHWSTAIG
jgi:hypothetical protein